MCGACERRNVAMLGAAYEAVRAVFGPHHTAGGEAVVWILGERVVKLTVMRRRAYAHLRAALRLAALPLLVPLEMRAVGALPGGRVAVYVVQPRVRLYRGSRRGDRPQTRHMVSGVAVEFGDGHWRNFAADGRLIDYGKIRVRGGAIASSTARTSSTDVTIA